MLNNRKGFLLISPKPPSGKTFWSLKFLRGMARVSRAFSKRDFRVSSVDHTTKRSTGLIGLITILDLTKDENLTDLFGLPASRAQRAGLHSFGTAMWHRLRSQRNSSSRLSRRNFFPSVAFSPGRNTGSCQYNELCRNMQSLLLGSIKREHGPIHSPVSVHGRWQQHKTKNKEHKTKQPKTQKPPTNKTTSKQHRIVILDKVALCKFKAACVLMVGPCVHQTRHRKQKHHNRKAPGKGAKSKTTRCGNPGSPQPGSRRSQRLSRRDAAYSSENQRVSKLFAGTHRSQPAES